MYARVTSTAVRASIITRRQRDALRLSAEGLTDRDIARRFGCTERTVRTHIFDACKRLNAHSRADAWRELGWLKPTYG